MAHCQQSETRSKTKNDGAFSKKSRGTRGTRGRGRRGGRGRGRCGEHQALVALDVLVGLPPLLVVETSGGDGGSLTRWVSCYFIREILRVGMSQSITSIGATCSCCGTVIIIELLVRILLLLALSALDPISLTFNQLVESTLLCSLDTRRSGLLPLKYIYISEHFV